MKITKLLVLITFSFGIFFTSCNKEIDVIEDVESMYSEVINDIDSKLSSLDVPEETKDEVLDQINNDLRIGNTSFPHDGQTVSLEEFEAEMKNFSGNSRSCPFIGFVNPSECAASAVNPWQPHVIVFTVVNITGAPIDEDFEYMVARKNTNGTLTFIQPWLRAKIHEGNISWTYVGYLSEGNYIICIKAKGCGFLVDLPNVSLPSCN